MYDQKLGFLPVGREAKREKNCSEKWLVNTALLVATNQSFFSIKGVGFFTFLIVCHFCSFILLRANSTHIIPFF